MEMVRTLAASLEANRDRPELDGLGESLTADGTATSDTASRTATTTTDAISAGDEAAESLYYKIENVGYRVGQRLSERYSKDRPRFADTLDVVKFICKDMWTKLFRKQIDNLKTNHRGVYILQDNKFRWLLHMSGDEGAAQASKRVAPFLWFPCGLIRGIMANLGVDCIVTIQETNLPQCTFQLKVVKSMLND
ncbi:hypothetical protein IWQ60_007246 [Tieghemiomyces parasiticus]|uniref:Trafficking protein particle complex subunit 6B n=1 Tax=Tieghemiomyces parasiticus TaxID=78921 RepID=A0A9W8A4L1_9FUNG|nr:hypothetical protein IWQ60_007246 [Tieghemiomyces parasiticus]